MAAVYTKHMDLVKLTKEVELVAQKAALYINQQKKHIKPSDIEKKGLNDLVSYVDKNTELEIVEALSILLPEAGFIAEENTKSNIKKYNWIIDPLDGTTNFLHNVPIVGVSIALVHNNDVLLGVVYEITNNLCFSAIKGYGAYLNNQKITVSKTPNLSKSLISTGFPVNNFTRMKPFLNTLEYLMQHTHGIRRFGAASIDLCFVACGQFDAFFEYNLKPWDVAAGALIVIEAGGQVCDFKQEQNWLFGKEMIATNSLIYKPFTELIKAQFKI